MIPFNHLSLKNINSKTLLFLFVLLSLLIWIDPFAFFRGDDWSFIFDYAEGKSFKDYALVAHGAHVITLFHFTYSCELMVFGKNAILFQVTSVVFWGICSFVFYLVLNRFSQHENSKYIAILISAVFCLHPNFSDIIYWIFQQGVILHLLFQLAAILFYLKYLKDENYKHLGIFLLFLILQNYYFGNGVLFPLLFVVHYCIAKKKFVDKFVITVLLIQILFVLVQKQLSHQEVSVTGILQNYYQIFMSFIKLVYVSVVRLFFVKYAMGNLLLFPAMALLGYISYLAFKKDRGHFFFALLYLLNVSAAIPIGRYQIVDFLPSDIHYYYSILLFPPLFIILFLAVSDFKARSLNIITTVLMVYLCGFFLINIQVKKIFSYRNFKNKEALTDAVKYSKPNFYPYDDAISSNGKNIYLDNMTNPSVLRSMQKNSNFEADSTIIKYLGEDYKRFISYNHKMIDSYKYLESNSRFDLDLGYEKKK